MKASEIFKERTAGMTEAPWKHGFEDGSGVVEEDGGGYIVGKEDGPVIISAVDDSYGIPQGVLKTPDADGIAFLRNLRDALLEYIRKNEEIVKQCDECRREYDPAGEVSHIGSQLDLALDALTERMEQK